MEILVNCRNGNAKRKMIGFSVILIVYHMSGITLKARRSLTPRITIKLGDYYTGSGNK